MMQLAKVKIKFKINQSFIFSCLTYIKIPQYKDPTQYVNHLSKADFISYIFYRTHICDYETTLKFQPKSLSIIFNLLNINRDQIDESCVLDRHYSCSKCEFEWKTCQTSLEEQLELYLKDLTEDQYELVDPVKVLDIYDYCDNCNDVLDECECDRCEICEELISLCSCENE